jgi:hypothetical protein
MNCLIIILAAEERIKMPLKIFFDPMVLYTRKLLASFFRPPQQAAKIACMSR